MVKIKIKNKIYYLRYNVQKITIINGQILKYLKTIISDPTIKTYKMIRCISFAQNFLLVISIILPISLILYDHVEYNSKIAEIAQKYHKLQLHKNDLIEELLKVQERRIDRAKELQALDGEKWERDKLEWKQWKHENLGVKKEEENLEKVHENPLPSSTHA